MPKEVVIYDGLCAICRQSVRWMKRLDWRQRLDYLDAQDWTTVHDRYPTLTQEAILGQIHIVTRSGMVYAGFEGIRAITPDLPLLMWVYPFLFLPGITWLGPKAYQWVADHRYQISAAVGAPVECDSGTCKIHRPAVKKS